MRHRKRTSQTPPIEVPHLTDPRAFLFRQATKLSRHSTEGRPHVSTTSSASCLPSPARIGARGCDDAVDPEMFSQLFSHEPVAYPFPDERESDGSLLLTPKPSRYLSANFASDIAGISRSSAFSHALLKPSVTDPIDDIPVSPVGRAASAQTVLAFDPDRKTTSQVPDTTGTPRIGEKFSSMQDNVIGDNSPYPSPHSRLKSLGTLHQSRNSGMLSFADFCNASAPET